MPWVLQISPVIVLICILSKYFIFLDSGLGLILIIIARQTLELRRGVGYVRHELGVLVYGGSRDRPCGLKPHLSL